MNYMHLEGMTLGQYELRQLIGEEAHIVATYQAYQPSLKRQVAVQVLNPEYQSNETIRQGFIRAAEIMANLEHSNIVPIHDFAMHDDLAYIVTRLMTGGSLRKRNEAGIIPLQEAVAIVKQISSALEYVHSRGMAHGDPSVANIVFDSWGSAYIADFHVAGFMSQPNPGELTGTPAYTAPEKWMTGQVSPFTDQYALASIAYHMIAGTAAFVGEVVVVMYKHGNETPTPPHTVNPDLPSAISDVLLRALAKNPAERYPTITDFSREFEKASAAQPKHLFISYSRRDKTYARHLTERLQQSGFNVWIDSQIEYGETWFREIDEAIKTCAAFVLLMTPDAYESEWVQKEILLAKRYRKPIFPLLLDGDEFPLVIDIQFADVKGGEMPDANFHRRLRRAVFGDV
jgi:serine/threonine protein kinase